VSNCKKKNSDKNKNHTPLPFKLNGCSLMVASLVDVMKNVTEKMGILNSLCTDVTVYQGTVIGTAVIYDSPIYQVLSVEDEDEVDNFKVVRRVPFDRGKDITLPPRNKTQLARWS
jgi:hypothetical protein